MELRSCGHLHFIQAIKGGSVTKVLNVTHGRPTLKFKEVTDIHDGFMFNHVGVKAERSCIDALDEITVKTEPDSSVCNPNDGQIINLDDDGFDNFTLKQIRQSCKTRKRKDSLGLNSSRSQIKVEDFSSLEDDTETQMTADDSDFMETLSSWRSKLSKKAKKRKCNKDPITYTQEIMPVVKSEEVQNDQEFPSSSVVSAALVEVKYEVLETDYLDEPDDYYCTVAEEDTEIIDEWNLENEFNCEWKEHADLIPLQIEWPASMNNIMSNSEQNNDQSPNFSALEFDSEECIILPDLSYTPPLAISLVEDHNSDTLDNQPDGDTDTPVTVPNAATHKGLDCVSLGSMDDSTFLGDCSKDEFTAGAEIQAKPSSTIEHGLSPGGCQVCSSNDSPESEEKQSFASIPDDEKRHVNEATDELNSGDEHKDSSKLHCRPARLLSTSSTIEHGLSPGGCQVCSSNDSPESEEKQSFASIPDDEKRHVNEATDELNSGDEHKDSSKLHCRPARLLSTRKAISPTSQEKLCKAMGSIDLNHKSNLKCRGKLYYGEQTDMKNGAGEGLNDIMRPGFSDNPNKVSSSPKTFKSGSHPKGIFKNPHSRPANRLGCNTVQNCSKSAIAFSKQQMHDVECLTMKLTKELKAMKDIVDDMLRSEFCLNTSLRYKVNEARMAVKNATRAEDAAKRCLSFMARDCSRFCKIMKLADGGPPTPQDAVRKEKKKIAFADEAGGRLCQVRFYKDEGESLSESK